MRCGGIGLDVGEGIERSGLGHEEEAELRVIGLGHVGGELRLFEAKLHIRLAGSDPDIAHQDVGESERVAARDGQRLALLGAGNGG